VSSSAGFDVGAAREKALYCIAVAESNRDGDRSVPEGIHPVCGSTSSEQQPQRS
jgi:hypothetical protein